MLIALLFTLTLVLVGCVEEPSVAEPDEIQGEMRDYVTEYLVIMKHRFDIFIDLFESNVHPENIIGDRNYYRTWFIASYTLTNPPRTYPNEVQYFLNNMYRWAFDGDMFVLLQGNELNPKAVQLFLDRYETYKSDLNIDDDKEQIILEELLGRYDNTEETLSSIAVQYFELIKNKNFQQAYQLLSSDSLIYLSQVEYSKAMEDKYKDREIKEITYKEIEDDTSRTTYVQMLIEETYKGEPTIYNVYLPLTWTNQDEWLVKYQDIFVD